MRHSLLTLLVSLLLGTTLALYIDDAGSVLARGGNATARIPASQGSPLRHARGIAIIKGLLQIRQFVCPSGYGECGNSDFCCPIGGDCCTDGCCGSGRFCCTDSGGGCCRDSEYCVPNGCCPVGEICSGGGGLPPPPPPPPPPHTTTHTITHPPPPPPTTTSTSTATTRSTSTTSPSKSTGSPSPTQPSSARPSPVSGETSVAYEVDDTRIIFTSGWTNVSDSSCTSKSRRTTVAMESFTVIIASASRIYLNIDVVSVEYDIFVNNAIMSHNSAGPQNCDYMPLAFSSTTNINITVVVVGPFNSGRKRQNSDDWSFQLNEILTFGSGSGSGSGGSSQASPSATTGQQSLNGAASFRLTWFQTIVVGLLVTFGL